MADRDALVIQAETEGFKAHIPDEPLTRIHTTKIDKTYRLYVSTLQTLLFDVFVMLIYQPGLLLSSLSSLSASLET